LVELCLPVAVGLKIHHEAGRVPKNAVTAARSVVPKSKSLSQPAQILETDIARS